MKLVWGITGAGDLMPETFAAMEEIAGKYRPEITVALSLAAQQVIRWYSLEDRLGRIATRICMEKDANTPFLAGPLQAGRYALLFVAPVTANTTAKIANGIADSLVSNCVAQANKGRVPTFLLPVDQHPGKTTTILPDGSSLTLYIRPVDIENVSKVRQMDGITILSSPDEFKEIIGKFGKNSYT